MCAGTNIKIYEEFSEEFVYIWKNFRNSISEIRKSIFPPKLLERWDHFCAKPFDTNVIRKLRESI